MGIVGIVARGFGVGAEILYFISEIGESADDGLFQLVAGVVGAYGDYGGRCGSCVILLSVVVCSAKLRNFVEQLLMSVNKRRDAQVVVAIGIEI